MMFSQYLVAVTDDVAGTSVTLPYSCSNLYGEAIKKYWVFRAQADWTFISPSELPTKGYATCREKCRRRLIRLLST
jgi:hypothetical protein